jgi:type I restriction enzyme M protein
MFENTFKNIDDILHKDAGCGSELDYVEQSSWILFLKYIDDLENARKIGAELGNKKYTPIISGKYRWTEWAVPKTEDGKIDHNTALTGDDLRSFVNNELFPFLAKFKSTATGPDTLEYKIGEIFGEIQNRLQSGYNLREVLELVDQLKFQTSAEIHEMSHLYEDKIKNMGNAGRNGGEYYTPRPLIKAIIEVVAPKIGQTIYDGAAGSAGFLCESFAYLSQSKQLTTNDVETLQRSTFFGKEKKSLAYIIGTMNMILHGIDAPNLMHANTLSENITDIQEKNRYDIVLANPPFGGKERAEVQQNFPIKTGETAYLFLQHFMKILKAGGRAGVIIKDTFLSNSDSASVSLRRELLQSHNLHTVLVCPSGTFSSTGTPTVVLFFEKGIPTEKIWFYELNPAHVLGKTSPLSDDDLQDFLAFSKSKSKSENSWSVQLESIDPKTMSLTPKNPNNAKHQSGRSISQIVSELHALEDQTNRILDLVTENSGVEEGDGKSERQIPSRPLRDLIVLHYGKGLSKEERSNAGSVLAYGANGPKCRTERFLFEGESIIVGRKGSAGELTRVSGKFWPLDVTYFITLKGVALDMDYLYFALKMLNIPSLARGVKPGINREDVYDLKIPVPTPAQQTKIVLLLTEIEKLKELGDTKRLALHSLQGTLMANIFNKVANVPN